MVMHVAKDGCSGSWGPVTRKMPYCVGRKRVRVAKDSFPGDRSPVPSCCPLGTGIALHLPSCAWAPAPSPSYAWAPLDDDWLPVQVDDMIDC